MASLNVVSFVFLFLLSVIVNSVNCWVLNSVDVGDMMRSLEEFDDYLSDEELMTVKINLIYPGTKWCGAGSIADNYDDLGSDVETDMCCREHDHCPDLIESGETRNNLTNDAFYTRLSCQCDEKFRKCLRATKSSAARNIGVLYFNAINTKCFRKDYPVVKCLKKGGWLNKKCLTHEYDTSAEKIYQWFDVKNF